MSRTAAYFARQLIHSGSSSSSSHRHHYVTQQPHTILSDRWQGTCRDCLQQLHIQLANNRSDCTAMGGHHLHSLTETLLECCECQTQVAYQVAQPLLEHYMVEALEFKRSQDLSQHHPLQSYRSVFNTVHTLYRMVRNALNEDKRPVKMDSEKPRELLVFDEPCVLLLRTIGFTLQNAIEYHPPAAFERLERAREELMVWAGRLQKRLPEAERFDQYRCQSTEIKMLELLGCAEYPRTRAMGALSEECHRELGIPSDAADELVVWAYEKLALEDPRQGYLDSLAEISRARGQPEPLQRIVDRERIENGRVAGPDLRAACRTLFGDEQLDASKVGGDTVRSAFCAQIQSAMQPKARAELVGHLKTLAAAKQREDPELIKFAEDETLWHHAAMEIDLWEVLPVGLGNIGNTCYLNCMLQCLYSIIPIRQAVQRFGDGKTWNEGLLDKKGLTSDEAKKAVECVGLLKQLFDGLVDARKQVGTTSIVKPDQVLVDLLLKRTDDSQQSQQQDVGECMVKCVSLLTNALPPSDNAGNWIDRLFTGHLEHLSASQQVRKDPFIPLNLNIPPEEGQQARSTDINECLEAFFEETQISGQPASSQVRVAEAPPILCLQIQRVQFDKERMRPYKINTHLRLHEQIELEPFADFLPEGLDKRRGLRQKLERVGGKLRTLEIPDRSGEQVLDSLEKAHRLMEGVAGWAGMVDMEQWLPDGNVIGQAEQLRDDLGGLKKRLKRTKDEWQTDRMALVEELDKVYQDIQVGNLTYTLHAVFIHSGRTPNYGHYWVFVRDWDAKRKEQRWLKFNDSQVSVAEKEVVMPKREAEARGWEVANPYYLVFVKSQKMEELVGFGI